jgi:hypothetical protein
MHLRPPGSAPITKTNSWSFFALLGRVSRVWLMCSLATTIAAAKFHWEPVPAEDLAVRESTAAPGSDIEILFSRHILEGDTTENYVRAKIYTKKGVETISVLSIEDGWNGEMSQLFARVVKADGSTVELTKHDFHRTLLWKRGDARAYRTTFAFPNLEPADVVEYRWLQAVPQWLWSYSRFYCQAENVFTREYTFQVRKAGYDFQVVWENCPTAELDPKSKKLVIRNLPPFVKEPMMPPDAEFRGIVTVIYMHPWMHGSLLDWPVIGALWYTGFKNATASNKTLTAKAHELTAGASRPRESVERIYRFVQTEIKNLDHDPSPALVAARKKRSRNDEPQKPARTLERRTGNAWDIDLLFAALVRATGLEVRLGVNGDRDQVLRINSSRGWVMADRRIVVVNLGESLGYYTPAEPFVPCGMLGHKDEGVMVYVCGESENKWLVTPIALPAQTTIHRTGHFTLDADGTLEGDVDVEFTGHRAIDERLALRGKSAADGLASLREDLTERLVTAEPSELVWRNLDDVSQPFTMHYRVRVPGYAQSVGSRLIFPLNFFTANSPVVFTNETRRYPIFIGFAEQDDDDVELTLPEGYELDGASAPARVANAASPINVNYTVGYLKKTRTITYRREGIFGGGGAVTFRAESYPAVRKIYDVIHQSDVHQLVLKAESASPAAAAAADATPPASSL